MSTKVSVVVLWHSRPFDLCLSKPLKEDLCQAHEVLTWSGLSVTFRVGGAIGFNNPQYLHIFFVGRVSICYDKELQSMATQALTISKWPPTFFLNGPFAIGCNVGSGGRSRAETTHLPHVAFSSHIMGSLTLGSWTLLLGSSKRGFLKGHVFSH